MPLSSQPEPVLAKRTRRMGRPSSDFSARSQILQGASRAFGREGFASTSVEAICLAADVSRRTFYRFFRSKDDVFDALYAAGASMLLGQVTSAVKAAVAPHEKIERGVEVYFKIQAEAGPLARVLALEPLNPNSKFAARHQKLITGFTELFHAERSSFGDGEVDPLVYRGLLAAVESITITLLAEGELSNDRIEQGKAAMIRIMTGTLMPVRSNAEEPFSHLPPVSADRSAAKQVKKASRSAMDGEMGAKSGLS